jgi:hypothetical protein
MQKRKEAAVNEVLIPMSGEMQTDDSIQQHAQSGGMTHLTSNILQVHNSVDLGESVLSQGNCERSDLNHHKSDHTMAIVTDVVAGIKKENMKNDARNEKNIENLDLNSCEAIGIGLHMPNREFAQGEVGFMNELFHV